MNFTFERDWESWADYHSTRVWRAVAARYNETRAEIVHYSNGFSGDLRYQCRVGLLIASINFQANDLHEAVTWLKSEMARQGIQNKVT